MFELRGRRHAATGMLPRVRCHPEVRCLPAELSIRDLPGMVVGHCILENGQVDEQQVEYSVEIDEVPETGNTGDIPADANMFWGMARLRQRRMRRTAIVSWKIDNLRDERDTVEGGGGVTVVDAGRDNGEEASGRTVGG